MNQFIYIGTELELFSQAKNWKQYIRSFLKRYIQGNVLEVGAGLGNNTKLLNNTRYNQWLCLEPDQKLFKKLQASIIENKIANCYVQNITIDNLDAQEMFDSVLYLDVLEHIFDDKQEVIKASQHLKIGGNFIVLAPAHQSLFTSFDTAIGHYRRYSKNSLQAIIPNNLKIVKFIYLDSVGLLASIANKLILKQSQPSLRQIQIWDSLMVPFSRRLDPIFKYKLGKSVLLITKKIRE